MGLRTLFRPKPTISDRELASGLRLLTWEGMASLGFFSITTSGFLAAYALALGADNLQIGILAALPFLSQPLQIPAIALVERFRRRKTIAFLTYLPGQLLWVPMALIPVFMDVPGAGAISLLLGLMGLRSIVAAVTSCAWNSWVKDLVPQHILGNVMGRRLALAGLAAMLFGLGAALFADYWKGHVSADAQALGYTIPFLFGFATLAIVSPILMTLMPEPLMQPVPEPKRSLLATVAEPFRDQNYRRLLRFLFLWGLAINLATPFFAVFMLQRLELPLSAVIGFGILSQAFNVLFLRVWGRFTDQFGNKAVLSLCVSLYLLVILGWTFTAMPDRYFFTIPLLVMLHIMAGIAASGVTLTTSTIGMKLAPEGRATAYLAGAGLALSLGAGLGPLLGGRFTDFFSVREVSLTFSWIDPNRYLDIGAVHLTGFDFLFVMTFVLGLITLAFLGSIREQGEVGREVVLDALRSPVRELTRPLSTTPGFGFLGHFPYGYLRRVPLPGLDVALGVTAYQIAEVARTASTAVHRGREATSKLARVLEERLSAVVGPAHELGKQGGEVARHAARGSMHALNRVGDGNDAGESARQAMLGVVRALHRSRVKPRDALRGAGRGVIEGAYEVQADTGEAAFGAVEAARELAREIGLTEEEAADQAAQGCLEGARALGLEALSQVETRLAGVSSTGEKPK